MQAPHIMMKAPHIMTKAPHIMMKAPHIMTKAPHKMMKAPHIMTKALNIMSTTYNVKKNDHLRQSRHSILLHMNHNDAIKLGDGERVMRLNKFFCLYYKVSGCPKYAFATLHLQAQVDCLLSPRLAHSLTWNRFVNLQGKVDTNFYGIGELS